MPYGELTAPSHDHAVTFYEDDAELVASVAAFVMAGLALGERTIVVTTAEHRTALDDALVREGLDLRNARATGQLQSLDAEETLADLMPDGRLDVPTIRVAMRDLIDAGSSGGTRVRAFGEMVALLWSQGNVAAALELEGLWNELVTARQFSLLCAYPVDVLGDASLEDLDRVCVLHSSVAPPRSYTSPRASTPHALAGTERKHRVFVSVPAAIPAVRSYVRQILGGWGLDDLVPDAVLVASELATNALRHARSPFRVALSRSGRSVRISVEDLGRDPPTLCQLTDDMTWGRGVFIVDDVCRAWGTVQLPLGKVVWADLSSNR